MGKPSEYCVEAFNSFDQIVPAQIERKETADTCFPTLTNLLLHRCRHISRRHYEKDHYQRVRRSKALGSQQSAARVGIVESCSPLSVMQTDGDFQRGRSDT